MTWVRDRWARWMQALQIRTPFFRLSLDEFAKVKGPPPGRPCPLTLIP